MTIQTYKAIQGGYVPSDDGPVVFKTDYLREIEHYQSDDRGKTNEINILTKENRALTAALAEKERSVHEKYKAELITQNDQLDRYEEQIAALEKRISDAGILKLAAENAALTARIKELEDELTAVKASNLVFVPELSDDMKDTEIERLEDRVKELEGALEKYGSHSPADGSPICERSKHSDYPCTCGFEAALGGKI
jgi:predicted RNase H-like nuclease (RuvC/YqgF family)